MKYRKEQIEPIRLDVLDEVKELRKDLKKLLEERLPEIEKRLENIHINVSNHLTEETNRMDNLLDFHKGVEKRVRNLEDSYNLNRGRDMAIIAGFSILVSFIVGYLLKVLS